MKKVLKIVGIVILIIAALFLIPPLFIDGKMDIEKEVTINQPKDVVFDYIKLLKNQDKFSVWQKMDPNMKKTYTGTDGTVGFVSAWDSENPDVGKGEQEILAIKEGERLDFELRFLEPYESKSKAYMITESIDSASVLVKWGFAGEMPYPMNIMKLFMNIEEDLGVQLQKGLDNLKAELEK